MFLKAMRSAIDKEELVEGRERLLLSASVSAEAERVSLFSPRELAVYVHNYTQNHHRTA